MRARSSIGSDNMSRPRNSAEPSVTVNFSLPDSTEASVLLPEPLGPIMACTSPALTVRSIPFNISLSPTDACRFLTTNISIYSFLFHFTLLVGYPTEPSRLIDSSFCASTANSIGSFDSTSRAYPLTISPTACSVDSPRWLQ